MALTAFEVFAKLSLDSSGYQKDLATKEKEASGFGSRLKSGLSTVGKVAGVAIGAATTAVVGFAKSSVSTGAQFDASMSQVAATMGTTVDQIQELRDFAQQMGATTSFSATEAADALNYMALAGYSADKSMKMLPNVLNLAAAGGIDLARASDMVTDAQSALGLDMVQTTAMVDQMARASSKSNTSVEQLGDAMLTIGATARSVRGGTGELATMLGALADNGIKGAEGGTKLRNMIMSLQSPTSAGAAAIERLKLNVYDANGNMRSMVDIVGDMQKGMEGMTQAEKDALISDIFNKQDMAAVNALLGTRADRFDELSEAIYNSTGAAQDMANVQLDNLSGDVTLFKSALEGVKIAVSDKLTPSLRDFVKLGSKGLSDITEAFKSGGLGGAMDALGDLLSNGLTMVIQKLPKFVEAGARVLLALVEGLIKNAPTIVTSAIQIVSTLASTLIQHLPALFEAGRQAVVTLATSIWQQLPSLLESGRQAIASFVSGFDPAALIERGGELLNNFVSKVLDYLPKLLDSGIKLVGEISDGISKNAPKIFKAITDVLTKLITTIIQKLPQFLAKGAELIVKMAQGIAQNLPNIVKAIAQMLAKLISTIVSNLPQFLAKGKEIISKMLSGLVGAQGTLISGLGSLLSRLVSAIVNKLGEFLAKGREIVSRIASGITGAVSAVVSAIVSVISRVVSSIAGKLGEFASKGREIVSRIGSGISGAVGSVTSAISGIISRIKSAFSINWSSVGSNIISGIKSGISNTASSLASRAASAARSAFQSMKNVLGIASPSKLARDEIGKNLALGIGVGLERFMPTGDMVDTVEGAFNQIAGITPPTISALSNVTATGGGYEPLLRDIITALQGLTGMGVYMDGKALVGQLVPSIDTALGQRVNYKERGIA